jgi:hypothetical protein
MLDDARLIQFIAPCITSSAITFRRSHPREFSPGPAQSIVTLQSLFPLPLEFHFPVCRLMDISGMRPTSTLAIVRPQTFSPSFPCSSMKSETAQNFRFPWLTGSELKAVGGRTLVIAIHPRPKRLASNRSQSGFSSLIPEIPIFSAPISPIPCPAVISAR